MNKTTAISLIALLLAGCIGTSTPVKTTGMYAILDPATGMTYHLPVPVLRLAKVLAGSLPGDVGQIGAVAHVVVPKNTTLVEASATQLTTIQRETVQIARVPEDIALPLKLRLDTEFASFALERVSRENT